MILFLASLHYCQSMYGCGKGNLFQDNFMPAHSTCVLLGQSNSSNKDHITSLAPLQLRTHVLHLCLHSDLLVVRGLQLLIG